MISWRLVTAWVAALVVATVLTWQIVGLADSQVGTPVVVAPSLTMTSTSEISANQTTSLGSSSTTSSTTTSSSTGSTNPTSSSQPATQDWSLRTVSTAGGVVVIRYRPEEVELEAATPTPGFGVEIDDRGPSRVRVEFEGGEIDVRVEARWENGTLAIDIDGGG